MYNMLKFFQVKILISHNYHLIKWNTEYQIQFPNPSPLGIIEYRYCMNEYISIFDFTTENISCNVGLN